MKLINKLCFFAPALLLFIYLSGCSEQSTDISNQPAKVMTVTEIKATPGYAWFDTEYSLYKPDTSFVNKIIDSLAKNQREFLIFVNPSCSCSGTQKVFPAVVKVLNLSGVKESQYKIYSMAKYNSPHPETSSIKLNSLPAVYIMKGGTAIYSVLDTLDFYQSTKDSMSIESCLLRGMRY